MARNGSGTFNRLYDWTDDAAAGVKISSTRMDAEMDGMATALTDSLAKDGQTTPTANLPMGTFRHTGVGAATARTDYARASQAQDDSFVYAAAGGTADAITLTLAPAITAYTAGLRVKTFATGANTATVTLNVNGVGATAVKKGGGNALVANDIPAAGYPLYFEHDGTDWELVNPAAVTTAGTQTVSGDKTFSGTSTFSGASNFDGAADFDSTVDLTGAVIQGAIPFVLEGATADGFETSIAVTDPTADNTITLPDLTGTILLSAYDSSVSTDVARTIASGNLNTGGDTTINLPAGAWLEIDVVLSALTTATDFVPYLRVNADSGNNYDGVQGISQSGAVTNQVALAASAVPLLAHNVLVESLNNSLDFRINIVDPVGTRRKNIRVSDTYYLDATGTKNGSFGVVGRWNSGSAITSISILLRDTVGSSPTGSTVNATAGKYIVRGYR